MKKRLVMLGIMCASMLMMGMASCGEPENNDSDNNKTENPEGGTTEKPDGGKTEEEPEPEPEPIPLPNISQDVPECSIKEFTNWQSNFASGDVIGDFSGLCLNFDRSGLIGVDNYLGGLWNINFDGTRESTRFVTTGKDMEGVTVDFENKIIYTCEEGSNYIWKICEEDGAWKHTRVKKISTKGESNSGLEGIAYHDGYLYVANQDPTQLFIFSVEHNDVAHSYTANFMSDCFSDLWFDTTNNTLWAVDAWSDGKEIVNFTVWGELIARFTSSVPWIEGICLDFENNKAWFACDSTGQLYSADIVRNN